MGRCGNRILTESAVLLIPTTPSSDPLEPVSPNPAATFQSPPTPRGASPEFLTWRDAAFWSFFLMGLVGALLLPVVGDPAQLKFFEKIVRHGQAPLTSEAAMVAETIGNMWWWVAALPLLAILIRWIPRSSFSQPQGRQRSEESAEKSVDGPPENPSACSSSRVSFSDACHPLALGLVVFQLLLGGAILTGTWTSIRARYWFPVPFSEEKIRADAIPRDLETSRQLERLIPPREDIYVLVDGNITALFLNYFLYPRRIYNPIGLEGLVERANEMDFWKARRAEGWRWVFLYRPFGDKIARGTLLELMDPTDSTNSANPTYPINPANPINRTDRTDPTDPTDSSPQSSPQSTSQGSSR